ncbi:MAG: ABC transporter permease subunit [Dehalococcoidales bacterium]
MISLFAKTLRDHRNSLLFWALGLAAAAFLMATFYPTIAESASAINQYIEAIPPELLALFAGGLSDFTSPAGFLNTELFFMIIPLLFMIFAIGRGSGAIAGEEESGTLDILLSYPLHRWQIVISKFASIAMQTFILAIVLWLSLLIGAAIVGMKIGWAELLAGCISAALLGLTFGTLALAVGCASGNKGLAIGAASGIAAISYFTNALAGAVSSVEPYQKFSLFYYYIGNDPLNHGLNAGHAGILLGVSIILLAAALLVFNKRDLSV